ncbi:MAG: DUF4402 domain-containing protein [Proteobacteria bacterium]|nr:DUF4402 domain-containing protein [Pseudomonadota bacterium]
MRRPVALAALIASAAPVQVWAAPGNTRTLTGTVRVTVVAPVVLQHTGGRQINFGKFTTGGAAGTVRVTAGGAGSVTGAARFVPGSAVTADAFTVTGDPRRLFAVATSGGNVISGANRIAFTTVPSAASVRLSATGTAAFTVGGTLTLTGAELPGAYSGTYIATVTYN